MCPSSGLIFRPCLPYGGPSVKLLEDSGLHLLEYVSPHGALELVGLVFVPNSFWIQHKPARLWKFRRASTALVRLRFVFTWQLMCWL